MADNGKSLSHSIAVLNHTFNVQDIGIMVPVYLALSYDLLQHTGHTPNEPSTGGYGRQLFTTSGALGDPAQISNNALIAFTATGATWTGLQSIALMNALTGGSVLYFGKLSSTKTINDGETLQFQQNAIVVGEQ